MDGDFYPAHFWIGQAAEKKGDIDRAIAAYLSALALSPNSPEVLASLGHAYAAAGQKDKARQILEQLSKLSEQNYVSSYLKSLVYEGLGETDQAILELEKSSLERSRAMPFLKVDPMLENLHTDKRFQELLSRMRF
jgi:tetratricopeptide (TPR) repeat protein